MIMQTSTLEWAKFYVKKGFSVIPLCERDKKPALLSWKKYQQVKPTEDALRTAFGNGSSSNIGIVTVAISGLAVVDVDKPELYEEDSPIILPPTPIVKTGKGLHYYYKYRDGARNFQGREDMPGIDLRGDGGYVVAPPSIHPSGHQYQWIEGAGPDDLPFAELPEIFLTTKQKHNKPLQELLNGVKEGKRNGSLTRLVGSKAKAGLTYDECLQFALDWNEKNSPPLAEEEVERTVKSIYDKEAQKSATRRIELVTFADILRMPQDTTPAIIEGVLNKGEAALITGPAGIGKSTMILDLCMALASAQPFMGEYAIATPHQMLLIQAENTLKTTQERLVRLTQDLPGDKITALQNIYSPWQNNSPQLIGKIADQNGNKTPFLQTVEDLICQAKADVVIFDPLISYHDSPENSNTEMRKALDILTELSIKHALTVILTHHHGKMYQEGSNMSRGASAIVDWASSILTLTKHKNPQYHCVEATWTKTRSFAPPEPLIFELTEGRFRNFNINGGKPSAADVAKVFQDANSNTIFGSNIMVAAITYSAQMN